MNTKGPEREWREGAIRNVAVVVGPVLCVTSFLMPRFAGIANPWRVTIPEELALTACLVVGGLASGLSYEVRARLVVGAGVALAWLLSTVYGPTAGLGVAHFVPVLGASLLLGPRFAWGVLLFSALAMVATGAVLTNDLVPAVLPHVLTRPEQGLFGTTSAWIRVAVTWAIAAGALTIVMQAMIAHVSASRDAAEDALSRARHEHEKREQAYRESEIAHRALMEAERALASAQRLESVGRLAGGVAHDFNNSLLVILAWADLLRRRSPSPETIGSGLDAIEQAANQAAQTSRQLLALARRNVRAPKRLDLGQLVVASARSLRRVFPADYVIATEVDDGCIVLADDAELHQLVLNLALNARDAMPNGGTVTIRVRLESLAVAEHVLLEVEDSGVGMDEVTLSKIFEPFFTTKGESGTGLGLAMVRRTVKDSNGTVDVESAIGEGTRFAIRLPLEHTAASERPPPSSETVTLSTCCVLYVEDEAPVRRAVMPALEHAGLRVLEARDGDEAMEVARRHRGGIDILCTDGIMPGMSTGQLIDGFLRLHPEASVVICSGHLESELLRKGVEEGKYAFVAKPYTGTELVALLRAELDEHRRREREVV